MTRTGSSLHVQRVYTEEECRKLTYQKSPHFTSSNLAITHFFFIEHWAAASRLTRRVDAGSENGGPSKFQGMKLQDMKLQDMKMLDIKMQDMKVTDGVCSSRRITLIFEIFRIGVVTARLRRRNADLYRPSAFS